MRITPVMAAGVTPSLWSFNDLMAAGPQLTAGREEFQTVLLPLRSINAGRPSYNPKLKIVNYFILRTTPTTTPQTRALRE